MSDNTCRPNIDHLLYLYVHVALKKVLLISRQNVIHYCTANNFIEFLQDLAELGAAVDSADDKGPAVPAVGCAVLLVPSSCRLYSPARVC